MSDCKPKLNTTAARLSILGLIVLIASPTSLCQQLAITNPVKGTVVTPGHTITIEVSVAKDAVFTGIQVLGQDFGITEVESSPPYLFKLTVPNQVIGPRSITALGIVSREQGAFSSSLMVDSETTATISLLTVNLAHIAFHYPGQEIPLNVAGTFDDGTELDITRSSLTSYTSADTAVAMVDPNGVVTATGSGATTILVSYGNQSALIQVLVLPAARGDLNGDGRIDQDDVNAILAASNTPAKGPFDARDLNRDGIIDIQDAKILASICTVPGCTVLIDNMAPIAVGTLTPSANPDGWNNSNVTVNLIATDNPGGSGVQQITSSATGAQTIANTSIIGRLATALISEEGLTSLIFFATDVAGNVEATQSLTIKLDKTPPSISGSQSPSANANGWTNTNVTVSFACADSLSGLAAGNPPSPTVLSAEGANQQVTGTCQDLANNTATATVSGINIDKTPPMIAPSRAPDASANGWNNTNVTVNFACTDSLSGLAAGSPPVPSILSTEGTNQQVSGTCFDFAGNSASATATGINIDKTPPAISGLPAGNCTLWPPNHKFVTVATISATDALSGVASFNVTGMSNEPMDPNDADILISGTGLGPRTVQLRADRLGAGSGRVYTVISTATDAAGNTVNAISTCTVPHDQAP
jgi:hypothetical protein